MKAVQSLVPRLTTSPANRTLDCSTEPLKAERKDYEAPSVSFQVHDGKAGTLAHCRM